MPCKDGDGVSRLGTSWWLYSLVRLWAWPLRERNWQQEWGGAAVPVAVPGMEMENTEMEAGAGWGWAVNRSGWRRALDAAVPVCGGNSDRLWREQHRQQTDAAPAF